MYTNYKHNTCLYNTVFMLKQWKNTQWKNDNIWSENCTSLKLGNFLEINGYLIISSFGKITAPFSKKKKKLESV